MVRVRRTPEGHTIVACPTCGVDVDVGIGTRWAHRFTSTAPSDAEIVVDCEVIHRCGGEGRGSAS